MHVTRRDCLLAALCWAEILEVSAQSEPALQWFDAEAAAEINAIARQIVPEDGTPGAERAGVIYFIDRALAGYDQDRQTLYREGLQKAQAERARLFPASTSIHGLSGEQCIELLKSIEKTEFFDQVRLHTVLGFLGHPMHGGNREMVGWKTIGIQHAMHYEPPFGFYDSPAAQP